MIETEQRLKEVAEWLSRQNPQNVDLILAENPGLLHEVQQVKYNFRKDLRRREQTEAGGYVLEPPPRYDPRLVTEINNELVVQPMLRANQKLRGVAQSQQVLTLATTTMTTTTMAEQRPPRGGQDQDLRDYLSQLGLSRPSEVERSQFSVLNQVNDKLLDLFRDEFQRRTRSQRFLNNQFWRQLSAKTRDLAQIAQLSGSPYETKLFSNLVFPIQHDPASYDLGVLFCREMRACYVQVQKQKNLFSEFQANLNAFLNFAYRQHYSKDPPLRLWTFERVESLHEDSSIQIFALLDNLSNLKASF